MRPAPKRKKYNLFQNENIDISIDGILECAELNDLKLEYSYLLNETILSYPDHKKRIVHYFLALYVLRHK